MEAVRGHLQAQLRNKEAENNRLQIQIRVQYLCDIEQTVPSALQSARWSGTVDFSGWGVEEYNYYFNVPLSVCGFKLVH